MTKRMTKTEKAFKAAFDEARKRHFNCVPVLMTNLCKIEPMVVAEMATGKTMDEAMTKAVETFRTN